MQFKENVTLWLWLILMNATLSSMEEWLVIACVSPSSSSSGQTCPKRWWCSQTSRLTSTFPASSRTRRCSATWSATARATGSRLTSGWVAASVNRPVYIILHFIITFSCSVQIICENNLQAVYDVIQGYRTAVQTISLLMSCLSVSISFLFQYINNWLKRCGKERNAKEKLIFPRKLSSVWWYIGA